MPKHWPYSFFGFVNPWLLFSLIFRSMHLIPTAVFSLLHSYSGVNIDVQNTFGRTALSKAAGYGRPATVKFLLSRGASLFLEVICGNIFWSRCGEYFSELTRLTTSLKFADRIQRDTLQWTGRGYRDGQKSRSYLKKLCWTVFMNAKLRSRNRSTGKNSK